MASTFSNTAGFDRQVDQLARRFTPAAVFLAKEIASVAARAMFAASPHDTNRFRRGWAVANNAAGLAPMPVPPVVKSKYAEQRRERLGRQIDRLKRTIAGLTGQIDRDEGKMRNWYDVPGRKPDKFYRQLKRDATRNYNRRQRLLDVLEAARREIAQYDDTAILIGGRKRKEGKDFGFSNLATVRRTVYGGSGRVYEGRGQVLVELRNLEAHASIVDSKFKVVAAGRAATRSLGGRAMAQMAAKRLTA